MLRSATRLRTPPNCDQSLSLCNDHADVGLAERVANSQESRQQNTLAGDRGRSGRLKQVVRGTAKNLADSYQRLERGLRSIEDIVRVCPLRNACPASDLGIGQSEGLRSTSKIVGEHLHRTKMFLTGQPRYVIYRLIRVAVFATISGVRM